MMLCASSRMTRCLADDQLSSERLLGRRAPRPTHHLTLCRIESSFMSLPLRVKPLFSRRKFDSITASATIRTLGSAVLLERMEREVVGERTTCQDNIVILQFLSFRDSVLTVEDENLETFGELLDLVLPLNDRNSRSENEGRPFWMVRLPIGENERDGLDRLSHTERENRKHQNQASRSRT